MQNNSSATSIKSTYDLRTHIGGVVIRPLSTFKNPNSFSSSKPDKSKRSMSANNSPRSSPLLNSTTLPSSLTSSSNVAVNQPSINSNISSGQVTATVTGSNNVNLGGNVSTTNQISSNANANQGPSLNSNINNLGPRCNLYIETLQDNNIGIFADCPACLWKVAMHDYKPVNIANANNSLNINAASAQSIAQNANNNPGNPAPNLSVAKLFDLTQKVAQQVGKWKRDSLSAHHLIQRISSILLISGLPDTEWPKVIQLVMPDEDTSQWCSENLILTKLNWDDASTQFINHYQETDWLLITRNKLDNLRMKAGERVQTYADKFTSLVSQLNIADNSDDILHKFIKHLTPSMQKYYYQSIATAAVTNPNFKVTSLRQMIDICGRLDIANQTAADQSSGVNNSSKSLTNTKSNTSQNLKCIYHPNSTNHKTADCRNPGTKSNNQNTSNTKSNSNNNKSNDKSKLQCFKCKAYGHLPTDADAPCKNMVANYNNNSNSKSAGNNPTPVQTRNNINQSSTGNSSVPKPPASNNARTVNTVDMSVNSETAQQPQSAGSACTIVSNSGSSSLDRTLPIHLMVGTRAYALIKLHGHFMTALVDGGADQCYIDTGLVDKFKLNIKKLSGVIKLASEDHTCARIGCTEPLPVTIMFPEEDRPAIDVAQTFEVMKIAGDAGYEFILGGSVLGKCFPQGIPLQYCGAVNNNCDNQLTLQTPRIKSVNIDAYINNHDVIEFIHQHPIVATSTCVDSQALDSSENVTEQNLNDVEPEEGTADKTEVYTPVELEDAYAAPRAQLMSRIQPLLEVNERITGFCNLDSAVFNFDVREEMKPKLFIRQYRIPQVIEEAANEVIERWLAEGKITKAPVGCPYNNPITVAPKRNANGDITGIRVCLDPRAVNAATIPNDRFEIPRIREILESFSGCSIFAELDLSEAYLQTRLHPDCQPYTAFTWRGVQYMFVGCPFGLTNMPGFFQRLIRTVFSDLGSVDPYLDNIPFGSKTWEEHEQQCITIINRLNSVNLRIKPSSVNVGHAHLRLLGHVVTSHGIGIDQKKLDALRQWPRPTTGKELQSFLGFVNFLREHVRGFSDLTAPLEAIKNVKVIEWNDMLDNHFKATVTAVVRSPVLCYPDFSCPFYIACDASNTGVGAVLFQPSNPEEYITPRNIVALCSKKLSPAATRYPAYRKELWGIVYALRFFRPYVWGRNDLVIITDHRPLTYMLTSKQLSLALQTYLDTLIEFSFEIRHRPGILHVLPDQLSRMYTATFTEPVWGILPTAHGFNWNPPGTALPDPVGESILIHAAKQNKMKPSVTTGSSALVDSSSPIGGGRSPVVNTTNVTESNTSINADPDLELVVRAAGIVNDSERDLIVQMEMRGKVAPPIPERVPLVEKYHLMGHFGQQAIFLKLFHDNYWWPKMRSDIADVISNCDACRRYTVGKEGYHPARDITASGPGVHLQIDLCVHLPASTEGHVALLVVIDVFTGFVVLRPLKDQSAATVARKLWKIFCLIGPPKILQSDNGSEFVNDIIRALVKVTGIDQRLITAYHPQADGKVERAIGSVMMIIKKLLHGTNQYWPLFVPFAQLTFNSKVSSLTLSTPFSLLFGHEPYEMKDYTEEKFPDGKSFTLDDWKQQQDKIVSLIYPAISARIRGRKDEMIKKLNAQRRLLTPESIPTGTTVMLKDVTRTDKFQPKYVGPYHVVRRARNGGYVLRDLTGDILDRHVTAEHLKIVRKGRQPKPPQNAQTYEIEKVLAHRGTPGNFEFFVKWKHYPDSESSWEPETNFHDDECIRDYWRRQQNPLGAKVETRGGML